MKYILSAGIIGVLALCTTVNAADNKIYAFGKERVDVFCPSDKAQCGYLKITHEPRCTIDINLDPGPTDSTLDLWDSGPHNKYDMGLVKPGRVNIVIRNCSNMDFNLKDKNTLSLQKEEALDRYRRATQEFYDAKDNYLNRFGGK